MRIRHLFEVTDGEFFWESLQDHGWAERGDRLVSARDQRISVDRDRWMYYRDIEIGTYTDKKYAELLRFESDPEVQKTLCFRNPRILRYASEAIKLAAVQEDGYAIQHIENPSESVQLAAVQEDGYAIQYIRDPSEAVQLAAVRCYALAIQYIKNPSEAVQLAAVRQYGYAIEYIEDPFEAVQLAAVQENAWSIGHIENPSEAVQLAAVRRDRLAIRHIENPSEAVKRAARESEIHQMP